MEDNVLNISVAGALIMFIIKELFVFLKSNKSDAGIASALSKMGSEMTVGMNNVAQAMNNSQMMLELIQERMRNHEDCARDRHNSTMKNYDILEKSINDHGKECREQARRVELRVDGALQK